MAAHFRIKLVQYEIHRRKNIAVKKTHKGYLIFFGAKSLWMRISVFNFFSMKYTVKYRSQKNK